MKCNFLTSKTYKIKYLYFASFAYDPGFESRKIISIKFTNFLLHSEPYSRTFFKFMLTIGILLLHEPMPKRSLSLYRSPKGGSTWARSIYILVVWQKSERFYKMDGWVHANFCANNLALITEFACIYV